MTSNFDFIKKTLPAIQSDCARAVSYLAGDPAEASFYSRRAIEQLVQHLYDVMGLTAPYHDLAARINDSAFKAKVGLGIAQKLNLIRRIGNTAAHESRPIQPQIALQVLRELFHVVVFAAYRYSTGPQGHRHPDRQGRAGRCWEDRGQAEPVRPAHRCQEIHQP
jgi:type I restriction enzyme R subunit